MSGRGRNRIRKGLYGFLVKVQGFDFYTDSDADTEGESLINTKLEYGSWKLHHKNSRN